MRLLTLRNCQRLYNNISYKKSFHYNYIPLLNNTINFFSSNSDDIISASLLIKNLPKNINENELKESINELFSDYKDNINSIEFDKNNDNKAMINFNSLIKALDASDKLNGIKLPNLNINDDDNKIELEMSTVFDGMNVKNLSNLDIYEDIKNDDDLKDFIESDDEDDNYLNYNEKLAKDNLYKQYQKKNVDPNKQEDPELLFRYLDEMEEGLMGKRRHDDLVGDDFDENLSFDKFLLKYYGNKEWRNFGFHLKDQSINDDVLDNNNNDNIDDNNDINLDNEYENDQEEFLYEKKKSLSSQVYDSIRENARNNIRNMRGIKQDIDDMSLVEKSPEEIENLLEENVRFDRWNVAPEDDKIKVGSPLEISRWNDPENIWDCLWSLSIINIGQTSHTVPGGRVNLVRALVSIGNGFGGYSMGKGKAATLDLALKKARANALKNIRWINTYRNGLSYDLYGKHNNCRVLLRSVRSGWGSKGPLWVTQILASYGITDVSVKIGGRRNPYSIMYALFNALSQHRGIEEIALSRGKRMVPLYKARSYGWSFKGNP